MKLRQVTFHGGELAPALHRRTDLEKYGSGLAQCRNAYIRAVGSAVNRSGMKYIATSKDGATKRSVLIPFRYSASQAYVLEFADGAMRVFKDGGQVIYPSTTGTILYATQANPCKISSGPCHVQNGDLIRISGVSGMTNLNGNDYTVDKYSSLAMDIINITKANPAVVTVKSHSGLVSGDRVWITGVGGMTQVNDLGFTTAGLVTKSFAVSGVTRGSVTTSIAVTGHTFAVNDVVWISGLVGGYELNNRAVTITSVVASVSISFALDSSNFSEYVKGGTVVLNSFQLSGINSTGYSTYTSGGSATRRTFELLGINSTAYGAYTSGGTYQYAPSWLGTPVTVTSPYLEADLSLIRWTQSYDVMSLFRHGFERRDLTRRDHHLWAFSTPKYGPSINPPATVTVSGGSAGNTDYYYAVTAVDKDSGEESFYRSNYITNMTPSSNNKVAWSAVPNALRYNVYGKAGKNGAESASYGFLGSTTELEFSDTATSSERITPVASDTPPEYIDPPTQLGNPGCGAYYKQRFVMGNFERGPQALRMSQIGRFKNFNVSSPVRDDDGISALLASVENQTIKHMLNLDDLVVLTESGEWIIRGDADDVVSPKTINAKQYGNRGSSDVVPVTVGEAVLYVTQSGRQMRDLLYTLETDKYSGNDIAIFVPHFFTGRTVVSMAYAQSPDSVLWIVLSDGRFASLTYLRSEKVWAWALHETDGYVEWTASVPENGDDVAYFVVKRKLNGTWTRTIERMPSRRFSDGRDGFFVDCGLSLDDPKTIESVSWANPVVITITGHGFSNGNLVDISDMIGETGLNDRRFTVANVTANTFELSGENGSALGAKYVVGTGKVRKAVTSVTGLSHLANESVAVCADGLSVGPLTVSGGGAITLSTAASRVHVGKSFTTRIQTLDPDLSKLALNEAGEQVNVRRTRVFVNDTRGGWAGPDTSHMVQARWVPSFEFPTLLKTGELAIEMERDWQMGSIVLEQRDPLPFELIAVEIQAETSDV